MNAQEIMKELDGIIADAPIIEDENPKCFGEFAGTNRCSMCDVEDECKESRAAAMKIVADELAAKNAAEVVDLDPSQYSIDEIESLVNAELAPPPEVAPEAVAEVAAPVKKKAAKKAPADEATDEIVKSALEGVDPAIAEQVVTLTAKFAKRRRVFVTLFIKNVLEQAADRKKAKEIHVECCKLAEVEVAEGITNYDVTKLFKLLA